MSAAELRALLAAGTVLAAGGCLASPPGHLPSSVRVLYSKATEDSLGSRTEIYFIVAREENELRLTAQSGVDRQPIFVPGLRRVFFTREVNGREEIWSMELDGSDERMVLGEAGEAFRDPAVSPDEAKLAYTRVVGGRSRVEVAGIDGSTPTVLAQGSRQPAWSPDGRRIAMVGERDGGSALLVIEATGGTPRPVTPSGGPQDDPAWSPDGARIAFTMGSGGSAEIGVVAVDGGAVTRMTENDVEDGSPSWSPSGERIVFVSRRPDGRYNLWLMDADGSDVDSLTRLDESDARDPNWL